MCACACACGVANVDVCETETKQQQKKNAENICCSRCFYDCKQAKCILLLVLQEK